MKLALCLFALASATLSAEEFHRQTISGGFLATRSVGDSNFLSDALRSTRPGANFAYGLNLTPHITIETGVDWVSHPLGSIGALGYNFNAGDNLFLIPFGARYGFGPADGKWRIYAGGGGAYAKYTFPSVAGFSLNQGNWGGYGLAGADYALGSHFRVGGVAKYYHLSQSNSLLNLGSFGITPTSFVTFGPQVGFTF